MINYSSILLRIRETLDLTQKEIAKTTGTTQPYIHAVEVGRVKKPSIDLIRELVLKLDVNPMIFIDEDEKVLFTSGGNEVQNLKKKIRQYEQQISKLNEIMMGNSGKAKATEVPK